MWGQKAELVGRRLVAASKVTRAGHLNEELTKALTGEDTINARTCTADRSRTSQSPSSSCGSTKSRSRPWSVSHGMWRRVKLVPFMERFAIHNRLRAVLRDEAQGILALPASWLL